MHTLSNTLQASASMILWARWVCSHYTTLLLWKDKRTAGCLVAQASVASGTVAVHSMQQFK